MNFISAADKHYFKALKNLAASIHYWHPECWLRIYNLGLTTVQKKELQTWHNTELFWSENGPPKTFNLDGELYDCKHASKPKKYAWKPMAIYDALETYERVFWLDAGSDIRGPLNAIFEIIDKDGYFLVKGQDVDMTAKLHNMVYKRMGLEKAAFKGKPSYAGNTQAYVKDSEVYKKVFLALLKASLNKATIAPFTSSLRNHRFDQSLLSLIAYSSGLNLHDHTAFLACNREQLSDDYCVASEKLIYTARRSSTDYLAYLKLRTR